MEQGENTVVSAVDGNGQRHDFPLEYVRWCSTTFWKKFMLDVEKWVDRLVKFANGCRFTAMSLVLQTPDVLLIRDDWVGLLHLRRGQVVAMVAFGDAVIPRPQHVFGYQVDEMLTHMAMCFGRGIALAGDILGLYVTEPTAVVRAWFWRLFVETAPDDRLVQEAWQPGTHPVVRRGLALLHRLTGGGSSAVLDRLLSVEVHCTTPEQDALVTQCRRAVGIVDVERPMKQRDIRIQSHAGEWDFKWYNVPIRFGDERVYERPDERLRWLAIWIVCTFSSRPGFDRVLQRTPDALLAALLPAIKRASKSLDDDDGTQTTTVDRRRRFRKRTRLQRSKRQASKMRKGGRPNSLATR